MTQWRSWRRGRSPSQGGSWLPRGWAAGRARGRGLRLGTLLGLPFGWLVACLFMSCATTGLHKHRYFTGHLSTCRHESKVLGMSELRQLLTFRHFSACSCSPFVTSPIMGVVSHI